MNSPQSKVLESDFCSNLNDEKCHHLWMHKLYNVRCTGFLTSDDTLFEDLLKISIYLNLFYFTRMKIMQKKTKQNILIRKIPLNPLVMILFITVN